MVVATNEASYDYTPASDQFIGMTRMRATELGVPLIHAAVTGKSVIIDSFGRLGEKTPLGAEVLLHGTIDEDHFTFYSLTGDLLLYLAAAGGILMWWRTRPLVGSAIPKHEEE